MDVIGYMDVIDSCFKGYFMKSNRLLEMVLKLAKEPELRFFCNRNRPTSNLDHETRFTTLLSSIISENRISQPTALSALSLLFTGVSDCVIWNDIHHKTQNHAGGEHGFPDANYFTNLFAELEAQGICEK